jgi:hypothetical protein
LSIYEKNQPKGKSFKALLSEDQDDIEFYNSIKKKHADKALITRQTRGREFPRPSRITINKSS